MGVAVDGTRKAVLSRKTILLFSVACGLTVANLYYAQPILSTVATAFGVSAGTAGLVVTFCQIGYAAGLALLVPLGDILVRRRLVLVMLAGTTLALVVSAIAPTMVFLIAAALVVGTGSVVAQVLVPMAASLANERDRGRVVGTVMSGLLLGILLARTVSGIVAGAASWRAVYAMAAVLNVVVAVALARALPSEERRPGMNYGSLLVTAARLLAQERVLQLRALFGALGFATFSVFWTTMAFLLSGAPYRYGDTSIGLFGLVGAAGALCANFAGRWVDKGFTRVTTLVFALCTAVSFPLLWWGRYDLVPLIIGIIVLDVGVQGLQVTNQSVIYRLVPDARSRVNSAYMVCYFAGGALGSALGSQIYVADHWAGVCVLGAALGTVSTVVASVAAARKTSRNSPPVNRIPTLSPGT